MDFDEALQIAKPILFNDEMTRAIIDRNKTVTRRVIKCRYSNTEIREKNGVLSECIKRAFPTAAYSFECKPQYNIDDYLYVREAWCTNENNEYFYRASTDKASGERWYPSIHMPKRAARIILQITNIKSNRLQTISSHDIIHEGLEHIVHINGSTDDVAMRTSFIGLWNSTIPKADISVYGYNANPWTWIYEFKLCFIKE